MKRLLTVLLVMAIMLCVGTIAYAATYSLNKTVPATITINNPPPPPPPPPPTEVDVYSDPALTTPLTSLAFEYIVGDSATTTVFVPSTLTASTIAVAAPGLPSGVTLTTTVNSPMGSYIPIVLELSGGTAGSYQSIDFTFTGSGSD